MYYKALVDINNKNIQIFKGKLELTLNNIMLGAEINIQDIEKDIELKASKKSEVFTLAIIE